MPKLYWKYVTGPEHLHPIQLYDQVLDETDMNLRFPIRNKELLNKISPRYI